MASDTDGFRISSEFSKRGDEIVLRRIEPLLDASEKGKFIAVDINTEAYELDKQDAQAVRRLLERCPGAEIWLARVGEPAAYRMRTLG